MTAAIDRIVSRVSRWPGVETAPHRFGGTAFVVAGRELGHVHDAGVVDLALTRRVRDALLTDGLADPHRVVPDSAWVTYRVRSDADVPDAMRLLRLAYLWRLLAVHRSDGGGGGGGSSRSRSSGGGGGTTTTTTTIIHASQRRLPKTTILSRLCTPIMLGRVGK